MKIFVRFLYLTGWMVVSPGVFSQSEPNNAELPKVIPPPAEPFAFAKYGNFNENLFKGAVDISIPLYNFKSALLSVPISLSYNASGIKVNDPAGSTGLGWSLNAGGVITRSEQGIKYPNKHEVFIPAISFRELTYGGNITPEVDPNSPYLDQFEYPRYELEKYFVSSAWFHKWRDTVITYGQNGSGTQTQVTNYFYENPNHVALTRTESFDSRGVLIKTENKYPHDFGGIAVYDSMVARNIIAPLIEQKRFQAGTLLAQSKTNYGMWYTNKIINPATVQMAQFNNPLETQLTYDLYDNKGNILQFTSKAGVPYSFVWGYKQVYPVAKIIGATYSEVLAALSQADQQLSYLQTLTDSLLIVELNKMRTNLKVNKPLAEVTTYTYSPLLGMTSERDVNNNATWFEYDASQRLKRIRDKDKNLIKEFDYRYTGLSGSNP